MGGRVVAIDPTTKDGDRRASCLERPAVRFAVDSARHAADDDEPGGGELAPQRPCDRPSV